MDLKNLPGSVFGKFRSRVWRERWSDGRRSQTVMSSRPVTIAPHLCISSALPATGKIGTKKKRERKKRNTGRKEKKQGENKERNQETNKFKNKEF